MYHALALRLISRRAGRSRFTTLRTASASKSVQQRVVRCRPTSPFSSMATSIAADHEDDEHEVEHATIIFQKASAPSSSKHCITCSCEGHDERNHNHPFALASSSATMPRQQSQSCHTPLHDPMEPLPKPNPEPKYSVRRRIIPPSLTPLNSPDGRQWLIQALTNDTAASYLTLTEHSLNQSDPAYCGITTLLIVLNALAVDPNVRWKGGWRYYASEDMLLATCRGCLDPRRIEREGVTLAEFGQLAQCQGLLVKMKQPLPVVAEDDDGDEVVDSNGGVNHVTDGRGLDEFRRDVVALLSEHHDGSQDESSNNMQTLQQQQQQQQHAPPGILVVSFGRSALGQTGDGHFSPIAAYHAETDQVLVMDVARFKYQHYWVKVETMYRAMQLLDKKTQQPRGWYKLHAPVAVDYEKSQGDQSRSLYYNLRSEDRRDVAYVPLAGKGHPCPIHPVKVEFCSSRIPPASVVLDETIC